ncbi:MAG: glycosyltransferase [Candidatus Wallbacteria bacterium]|nr:glycosyltransferase [Candidatus Wallbacteria bacterium]
MKLAFYHNVPFGGAMRVLWEYVRRLAGRHEITLFHPELVRERPDIYGFQPAPAAGFDWDAHVRRHHRFPDPRGSFPRVGSGRLNLLFRSLDLPFLERASRWMAAEIDAGGFDAVFVNPCRLTQAPLLLRHLKTPTVYYCAEPSRLVFERRLAALEAGRAPGARLALRRLFLAPLECADVSNARAARIVLAHSLYTANQIRLAYGLEPVLQYLGVDTDVYRPLERPRQRRVVSVSAIGANKDQLFLVRALAAIPAPQRPPVVFAYSRFDPAYLEELKREAAAAGVTLELRQGDDDAAVVELYASSRVAACTPVREPFGLIPLEAMACGTPVAGVAEGGLLETIEHGVNGLLTPRDPEAFAAALLTLLDSASERERLSQAGLAAVRGRWSWDASAARLESELARAAAMPRR